MKLFGKKQANPDQASAQAGLGNHMSKRKTTVWLALVIMLFAGLIVLAGGLFWYQKNTAPLNPDGEQRFFTVEEGDAATVVADRLKEQDFIHSALAFKISLRLDGAAASIKPGKYRLSPAMSAREIITELQTGVPDIIEFTIIPGENLLDVRKKLREVGYSEQAIEEALTREYDHPALASKPPEASLEGYLYPDTYEVDREQPPSAIVEKALDNFNRQVEAQNLRQAFGDSELTFHQAVIMASIVEREVNTDKDRPIVAQVFLKRLEIDMKLGADSTFVYAAQQMGVDPRVRLESPYNTRINPGLPPGPIASFTIDALQAVANPADTEYLYFVTGDNNVTHYARTAQGHQENVEKYCGERCEL